jgi:hypothetical protein
MEDKKVLIFLLDFICMSIKDMEGGINNIKDEMKEWLPILTSYDPNAKFYLECDENNGYSIRINFNFEGKIKLEIWETVLDKLIDYRDCLYNDVGWINKNIQNIGSGLRIISFKDNIIETPNKRNTSFQLIKTLEVVKIK